MTQLIPNLMVSSVGETVLFYQVEFGFELETIVSTDKKVHDQVCENESYIWAKMKLGNTELMFQETKNFHEDIGFSVGDHSVATASFYVRIEGVEALYEKLRAKCIKPLQTTWYGMKEFYIKDNNGYIFCFGEPDPNFSM